MKRTIQALEIRYLSALIAVGREGSFSRAGVALHYTQSAVSQQIRRLEDIVGQQLVERPGGPNPVTLTPAGHVLVNHGEAIMARLDSALADLKALAQGESGELRIGYYQSLGNQVLPRIVQAFSATWPHVSIQLTEAEDDLALLQQVERGELDLTFMVYPMTAGPFAHTELFDDPYVVVVPEDNALGRDGTPIHPRELRAYRLITYARMRPVHAIEQRLGMPELSQQILLRSNNNATILGLVRAGAGVALISQLSAGPFHDQLRAVPLARVNPRVVGIAWHRDRYQPPALQAFIRTAQTHAGYHGAE